MRGRSKRQVITVDLYASRSIVRQPEVADDLIFDPLGDPGDCRIIAVRHTPIKLTLSEAFGNETDAHKLLRRSTEGFPCSSLLSCRRHIVFAGARLPCFPPF